LDFGLYSSLFGYVKGERRSKGGGKGGLRGSRKVGIWEVEGREGVGRWEFGKWEEPEKSSKWRLGKWKELSEE
jgi:hypothetical protein